jgi:hypothetical protein
MKYALICQTMMQGQVVQRGDIYDTQAEAEAEHADMTEHCIAEGMDTYSDFHVGAISQRIDGKWEDGFGSPVLVMEQET